MGGYPFRIGNVFEITGNTATSTSDTAYYQNFYYYLYDIHLKSPGCASTVKQPVTLGKPVITQNGTVLTSNFTAGNQWYLNGNAIAGATNQTFTPAHSGTYTVYITLSSGCIAQSDNFVYVVTATNPGGGDIGLTVFPIPTTTDNLLNIVFVAKTDVALKMSMINTAGQVAYTQKESLTAGNFSTTINVSNMVAGTYVLELLLGDKKYTRKVVVGK